MREFNTSGPCDPKEHYCVLRETLLKDGLTKIKKNRFFTIWAPRQSGKTTYFQLLIKEIDKNYPEFKAIWISFEAYTNYSIESFYRSVSRALSKRLKEVEIFVDTEGFLVFLENFYKTCEKKLVLIIEEFEGIPKIVIQEFMHGLRRIYHEREYNNIQSVILVLSLIHI